MFLLPTFKSNAQQAAYFKLGEAQFKGIQIYDVIQDEKLNYLFATNEGIFYYDYYNYEKLECDKAKSTSTFGFAKGMDGTIYCHNLNNQIFQIKNKKFTLLYELKDDEQSSDISLSISDLGDLVIGAKKIIVLNKEGELLQKYNQHLHYLNKVFKTNDNSLIFHLSISDSILVFKNGAFSKQKLNTPFNHNLTYLNFIRIGQLTYALDLRTKILYDFNFEKLTLKENEQNELFRQIESFRIYQTKNEVWLAGTLPGVYMLNEKTKTKQNSIYYEDYYISDVFNDAEGNILLSTFDEGVIVIPDINIPDVINTFKNDLISSLNSNPQIGLVLGSSKGKLYNYAENKLNTIIDADKLSIITLQGNMDGSYMVFDDGKIKLYTTKTKTTQDVTEASLKDAEFISNNKIYLATNRGLILMTINEKGKPEIEHIKNLSFRLYNIQYDKKNRLLYASSTRGLFAMDENFDTTCIKFNNEDIFPTSTFLYNDKIYISTKKNGILILENKKITGSILPNVNGKPEVLKKIVVYNNTIIASTSNSLYQLDMQGKLIRSLHSIFGFSSSWVLDFTFHEGNLWVSHTNGVQKLNLNYINKSEKVPSISLNKISVNDLDYNSSSSNQLSSDQRKLEFILSSPTLRNHETTVYHYKLIGYDTKWSINPYQANKISYNALAPGTYTFQVKAENQGVFSKVVHFSFTINQPIYLRWWFITLCILAFLIGVFILYKWQLNIQRKKSQLTNELNASKLTAIQSQMNPHFIFNSLNSIQDLILKGNIEHSYTYITTFSNLVRRTLNYSEKDFIDFDQEIKLLELYLSLEKLRFKKDFNYELIYKDIDDILIPPLLIQPFIENALVHGLLHKEGAKNLKITFTLTDILICTVEDNGVGREKAKAIKQRQHAEHESFSGKAIKKRFEILTNVFEGEYGYVYEDLYENGEAIGTKVILMIPVRQKF